MSHFLFQTLGFSPINDLGHGARPHGPVAAWLYRHDYTAQDGSWLYLGLPYGISIWRLSNLPWPLDGRDLVADVPPNDLIGLARATDAFFRRHGGRATRIEAPARSRPVDFPSEASR